MTERRFQDPITRCARRPRLVRQAMLIVLAALVLWLMSGCQWRESMPAEKAASVALLVVVVTALVVFAVVKTRENEMAAWDNFGERMEPMPCRESLEAELRWSAKEAAILCADDQIKLILGLEDLRGIVGACRAESRVSLLFVEAALTTTDVDDYADALRAAHAKLLQVTKTLGDLQRSLQNTDTTQRVPTTEGAA